VAASIAITTADTASAVRAARPGKSILSRLFERFATARIADVRTEIARSPHLASYEARDARLMELAGRD